MEFSFKRDFYEDVVASMTKYRVTFLLGARKCGKTVCLKQINEAFGNTEYIDFKNPKENDNVFLRIQESIEKDEDRIYLLDEITYAPNPEKNICMVADAFSEFYSKNVHIVFTGSQSVALEKWASIAFGGVASFIRAGFLSYPEWLRYKSINTPTAENHEQFLLNAMDFYGFPSMQAYLQGCIDETILSNSRTTNYLYGNECHLLTADILLDVCYATLLTLHSHVNEQTFMKADYLKTDMETYFPKLCRELNLDERISASFIERYKSFQRRDLKTLEQAFLFLKNCDLINITPVVHNLDDDIPDMEQELNLIAYGEQARINFKKELFRDFNMTIKYPVFYMAILRDIFRESMPEHIPAALLGSIVECETRGILPDRGAVELHDMADREIDYVNVLQNVAIEITIKNKSAKEVHFEILPDNYRCLLFTKDKDFVDSEKIIRKPYYEVLAGKEILKMIKEELESKYTENQKKTKKPCSDECGQEELVPPTWEPDR